MRILLDECLPEDLADWLKAWDVKTVQQMGWRIRGINVKGRRLAILVLPSNRLRVLRRIVGDIEAAIAGVVPGQTNQYTELPQPTA